MPAVYSRSLGMYIYLKLQNRNKNLTSQSYNLTSQSAIRGDNIKVECYEAN